ncbi:MAG: hypothetical protein HQ478_13585 [Chloroflexi bacterium]|nr:hypothetical protein [Chloroflexota bacterium]
MTSNFILTGPPGTGKSELLSATVERHSQLRWRGFISASIIENGERVGWAFKGINSAQGVLAHVDLTSESRMGRYGIDLNLFASIVDAELDPERSADAYVIDEVGLISAMYPPFDGLFATCLDSETSVVAIVREKSTEILERYGTRSDTEIVHIDTPDIDSAMSRLKHWMNGMNGMNGMTNNIRNDVQTGDVMALISEMRGHIRAGGQKFTRDEMNER